MVLEWTSAYAGTLLNLFNNRLRPWMPFSPHSHDGSYRYKNTEGGHIIGIERYFFLQLSVVFRPDSPLFVSMVGAFWFPKMNGSGFFLSGYGCAHFNGLPMTPLVCLALWPFQWKGFPLLVNGWIAVSITVYRLLNRLLFKSANQRSAWRYSWTHGWVASHNFRQIVCAVGWSTNGRKKMMPKMVLQISTG